MNESKCALRDGPQPTYSSTLLSRSRFLIPLVRIDRYFDLLAARISNSDFIVFDRYSIWFYAICIAVLLLMCLADISGSSIAILSTAYPYGARGSQPLLGAPRGIRSDEWNYHTPLILNQYLRPDRFSPKDTLLGPGNTGLIGNAPVRHFTTLFRPQFWGFFVLPFDYAYSIYWEAKWFIPATGLFTLLLMLTTSTSVSVVGTLWFIFSALTQWQFSWPSLLPDMVGLCAWIVCLICYLLTSRDNWKALTLAALGLVACSINFAMCAYVPHQIPLAWFAVFVTASWTAARVSTILDRRFLRTRIAVLLLAFGVLAAAMVFLYHDLAQTITAMANTSYPGHRSLGGGGYNLAILGSHFLDFWKTEARFPPSLGNICEATGFLWLAPATLFCLSRVKTIPATQKVVFVSLGILFLSLWSFELLPIPARITRLVLLDRVPPGRALPALGLVNILLVALVLTWPRRSVKRRFIDRSLEGGGILAVTLMILGLVNLGFGNFYSLLVLSITAVLVTIVVMLLLEGRTLWFGIAVVIPSILTYSGVNPLQRGFDTVFRSELFQLVQSSPALREGKWLVFSLDIVPSGFFSDVGCDVFTGLKYVPELKDLKVFDPTGENYDKLNHSGFLLAILDANRRSEEFENHLTVTIWRVNPLDPKLRKIGIRYVAFQSQPPPDILRSLKPIAPNPVSTFWIYELP